MVSSVGAHKTFYDCSLLYSAHAQNPKQSEINTDNQHDNNPSFLEVLKENGKVTYKNFTIKEFMPDNRDAKLGDAKEYGSLAQALSSANKLFQTYKTADEITPLALVNFSDATIQNADDTDTTTDIKGTGISDELKSEFSSLQELNDTYTLLQHADFNKDGQVTKKELLQLKKILEQQRDQLNKLKTDKKVMESLQGSGAAKAQQKQINEISKKIKQIDNLLHKDATGNNLFGDIASEFGDGQSVDLDSFGKAVVEANVGAPIDVSV